MAFTLKPSLCANCDTLVYEDETGTYNATTNPGGYTGPGAPTGPADFTTYTLEVWYPGSDRNNPADYTLNLLTSIPSPDVDGFYTWPAITLAELGMTTLADGVYQIEVTAIYSGTDYGKLLKVLSVSTLKGNIRSKVNASDPLCDCDDDCNDPMVLWNRLKRAQLAAECGQTTQASTITNWLLANWQNCC